MSLDKPHHGWEGISNGGEIYGESNKKNEPRKSDEDIGREMRELADEINRQLEMIKLENETFKIEQSDEEKSNSFHK